MKLLFSLMLVVTLYGLTSCHPQPRDIPCNGLRPGYCHDNQTCCPDPKTNNVCCNHENGVCCANDRCCPSGYTCSSDGYHCYSSLMKPIPASIRMNTMIKKAVLQDIPCQGGSCPDGDTCCPNAPYPYYCCPDSDGNCCGNTKYCCPSGHTCSSDGLHCYANLMKPIPVIRMNTIIKKAAGLQGIPCLDGSCPDGDYTCCPNAPQPSNCCPVSDGVCCGDTAYCCPGGTTCGDDGRCHSLSNLRKPIPAILMTTRK